MGTNDRKTRRGGWTPLELFIAGVRQMGDESSELAVGRRNIKSQLTFNLQPLGEDQGLTVRIPKHELSLAVMAGDRVARVVRFHQVGRRSFLA
jgi:hypothetical protein